MDKKKICFITAVPITAKAFLRKHMAALSSSYDIHYVCNAQQADVADLPCKEFYSLQIERKFSPVKDLKALRKLYKYFKANKFVAVHSVTPKAGLLTALAGWRARVPVRIHIFTGQVWATRKGLMRWLLKAIDKIIIRLDTHILVDGKSQRAFLEKEGVLKKGQATVFGEGSISGVDTDRFTPNADVRKEIRQNLGIKDDALVYLFMGRLNCDKGIGELLEAYDRLVSEAGNVFLLLVGWNEGDYLSRLSQYPHINGTNFHYYGSTPEPETVLNAGDVFVLPTYREGFGTSVLEAACIGLPSITSDAYGVLDSVVEGETGLRCKVGDAQCLFNRMKYFNEHRDAVKEMGRNGRDRVLKDFTGEKLTACWVEFYGSLISE